VNTENNIKMFVSIAKQDLVKRILKEREDSNAVTRHIGLRLASSIKVVQGSKILQAEQLNNPVSDAHGYIDPTRRSLSRCQEVLKGRAINPPRGYSPSIMEACALKKPGGSAVQRRFGLARGGLHAA
jgi:hypothetical protein